MSEQDKAGRLAGTTLTYAEAVRASGAFPDLDDGALHRLHADSKKSSEGESTKGIIVWVALTLLSALGAMAARANDVLDPTEAFFIFVLAAFISLIIGIAASVQPSPARLLSVPNGQQTLRAEIVRRGLPDPEAAAVTAATATDPPRTEANSS